MMGEEWSVREIANRFPDLTGVEFTTRMGRVHGWARVNGRVTCVPFGWHAYSATGTGVDGPIGIVPLGSRPDRLFDFLTDVNLDGMIVMRRVSSVEAWRFTGESIRDAQ